MWPGGACCRIGKWKCMVSSRLATGGHPAKPAGSSVRCRSSISPHPKCASPALHRLLRQSDYESSIRISCNSRIRPWPKALSIRLFRHRQRGCLSLSSCHTDESAVGIRSRMSLTALRSRTCRAARPFAEARQPSAGACAAQMWLEC